MHLISSFLYSFSANLDIFIVGLSYGVKKSHIPLRQNLAISLITFSGTILSLKLGTQLTAFIPPGSARLFGCMILLLLGSYYTIKSLLPQKAVQPDTGLQTTPHASPPGQPKPLSLPPGTTSLQMREAVALGFALSINNIGMGIGASISGVEAIPTSLITLFLSFVFLLTGNHIGKMRLLGAAGRFADTAAGILLIGLGAYELFI